MRKLKLKTSSGGETGFFDKIWSSENAPLYKQYKSISVYLQQNRHIPAAISGCMDILCTPSDGRLVGCTGSGVGGLDGVGSGVT